MPRFVSRYPVDLEPDLGWLDDVEPVESERVFTVGDRTYRLRLTEDDPRHAELLVGTVALVPLVTCWRQTDFDHLIPSLRAEGYIREEVTS